jgi:hypothetical protein
MWTKRILLLVVILVIVALLFSQEKTPTKTSPSLGYQLVAAPITLNSTKGNWEEHRVFLVDSSSGNVWEFLPEHIDKEQVFHASSFQPVSVKK